MTFAIALCRVYTVYADSGSHSGQPHTYVLAVPILDFLCYCYGCVPGEFSIDVVSAYYCSVKVSEERFLNLACCVDNYIH